MQGNLIHQAIAKGAKNQKLSRLEVSSIIDTAKCKSEYGGILRMGLSYGKVEDPGQKI